MIKRQDGVVIIAVLWVCALIMWLALQIGAETRLQAEERVHRLRQSQAFYLAVGGAYEALARMGQPLPLDAEDSKETESSNWQPDGKVHEVFYGSGKALVAVHKETDKVNINKANQKQIKAVLEEKGLEEEEADRLADVIADFVDADDIPGLHGAEEDYYKKEKLHHVPFNNELTSIDQMLLIPGVSQQLFYGFELNDEEADGDRLASVVSMLSNKDSLFQMFTVYGNNLSLEDEEIQEQAAGKGGTALRLKADDTEEEEAEKETTYITWQVGETYRILSCGKLSSGAPIVVLCLIVKYSPESGKGYEVLYRKIL